MANASIKAAFRQFWNHVIARTGDMITTANTYTDTKTEEAKSYTDTKTSGLASTAVVDNKISTHNTSTTAHNDIRVLITDLTTKLNNFLDVDDTTTDQLSEVLALIENNRGTLESLTTNKVNVSDIIDNLTTNNSSKVLSAAQGVAVKNLIDALQTAVNGKQSAVTGGASTITSSNLTSNRALVSNGSGKVAISDITSTELGYLDGVTANVQTQLNAKAASSHTHDYAGSSSAGGAATSANKLNTDAGSVTQPVYFKDGVPVSTSHTLNADVPENAKFTDTTYEVATQSTDGLLSADDKTQLDNGGIPIVTTSGDGSAYTATVDGISTLTAGIKVTIIPHVTSTTTSPTFNVNSLGAKSIRMPITYNSSATSVGSVTSWIVKNIPITVEYDGSYWKTISCPRPSAQYLYGTVPVDSGGTGLSSVTSNSFLVGNGTSNMVEKTSSEVMELIANNTSGTYCPYYKVGDSFNGYWYGAGFITSTKKKVEFSIPLAKPILGNPEVNVACSLKIRQNGAYCYGSEAQQDALPDDYELSIGLGGNSINCVCIFDTSLVDVSTVKNNACCGIAAYVNVKFL